MCSGVPKHIQNIRHNGNRQNKIIGGIQRSRFFSASERMKDEIGEISTLNALLIPSITERILSLCEINELKACRLVCQEWNIEAWKHLRKRSKIVFQTPEDIKQFLQHYPSSSFEPINFKLGSQQDLDNDLVRRFFLLFGELIEFLDLDRTYWSFTTLWEILRKNLPNLVELKLNFNHEPSLQNSQTLHTLHFEKLKNLSLNCNLINDASCQLLLKILAASPNINTLSSLQCVPAFPVSSRQVDFRLQRLARPRRSLPGHYYHHNHRQENNLPLRVTHFLEKFAVSNSSRFGDLILSQMLLNNDSLLLENLTNLNLELIIIENNDLVKLTKQRFPLKNLAIVLCGGNISSSILYDSIKNFRNSLTFLRINYLNKHLLCNTSTNAIPGSEFMKQLKKLHLEEYTGSLNFIESLTILQVLTISKSDFGNCLTSCKHSSGTTRVILPHNLKTLIVENNTVKICMAKTVSTLCQRFPNLRKLTLGHLTDESIRVIFGNLKELQEFTAIEGYFTDIGITGISSANFNKLRSYAIHDHRVKSLRIHPYIGNLKQLRIVSLESTKLTEISLIFGIAFCKRIKNIALVNPKKNSTYNIEKRNMTLYCRE